MLNKSTYIFLLLIIFASRTLTAQYAYEWNDYYGGDAQDKLSSFVTTFDGNIILAGTAKDSVDAMWLVKINPAGIRHWSKLYTGYPLIKPVKVIETKDKNILVAGVIAEQNSIAHKIWLIKIDQNGDILWEKLYSGRGDAYVSDIVETYDSGIVIAGYTAVNTQEHPDWYLMKLDSLGNFVWEKSFGGPHDDRALSVDQMYDNSIVVVGYISYALGAFKKASVSKFSSSGQDIWFNDLSLGVWSRATSVVSTSDSAIVLSAEIKKNALIDFDISIIKMTGNGDKIWEQTLNDSLWEQPVNIIETYDQGYALAYTSKSHGVFNTNIGVVKLNTFGNIAWKRIFKRESDDYAAQIMEGADNGLIVATSTYTIDKAWNFGVLKYKNLEKSDLKFITPYEPILTISEQKIPINAYIKGYKKPISIRVYINQKLITTISKFQVIDIDNWNYSIELDLELKNGLNIVDFVVTDYKEYEFIKSRKIYYLPGANPHW